MGGMEFSSTAPTVVHDQVKPDVDITLPIIPLYLNIVVEIYLALSFTVNEY